MAYTIPIKHLNFTNCSLIYALDKISIDDLKHAFGNTIYNRGKNYVNEILEIEMIDEYTLEAEIQGNYGDYDVNIYIERSNLKGKCDCPHADEGNLCKHLVGVILYAKGNIKKLVVPENSQPKNNTTNISTSTSTEKKILDEIGELLEKLDDEIIKKASSVELSEILQQIKKIYQKK